MYKSRERQQQQQNKVVTSVLIKHIKDPVMVQGLITVLLKVINKTCLKLRIFTKTQLGSAQHKPLRGGMEDPGKISPFVTVSSKFGEQRILGTRRSPVQTLFTGVPSQPPFQPS